MLPSPDAFLNAGEVTVFGRVCQSGTNEIEINIGHAGDEGDVVEEGLTFEAALPETALNLIFCIGRTGDEFIEAPHEPAEAGEALAQLSDAMGRS